MLVSNKAMHCSSPSLAELLAASPQGRQLIDLSTDYETKEHQTKDLV